MARIRQGNRRARRLVVLGVIVGIAVLSVAVNMINGASLWEALFVEDSGLRVWHVLVLAVLLFVIARYLLPLFGRWAIYIFEHDKIAHTVRIASLALLLVGFHFDMLAS